MTSSVTAHGIHRDQDRRGRSSRPLASGPVVCVVLGVLWPRTELPAWPAALLVFGAAALVDWVVVARRTLRGEPG